MKKIIYFSLIITHSLISFTAAIPNWVYKGSEDGTYRFYGVGSAKRHIKGKSEQKKLALKRAIDEIASQKEATINSEIDVYRIDDKSYYHEKSNQKINGLKVSSKILETWENPQTQELFILVGGN